MLLTVVAWAFQRGPNEGMVWAALGGLAVDLASGAPLGISPPPLMVAALVAGVGRRRVFHGNLVLPALISLFAIALYQMIYLVLLALTGQPPSWRVGIVQIGVPLVLLHLALMPIVYFATGWLVRLTQDPRVRLGR